MYFDLNALKQAAPLIPYVKQYYPEIKIVYEGQGLVKCLCPFHNEKTGSLILYANGTFKCFGGGCGAQGDIVNFVERMEHLEFEDACKLIGDNVGFEINFIPPNPYYEAYKKQMTDHARRYWYNLQVNQNAISYLEQRGITKETRNEFRLGLTDSNEYKYRNDIGGIAKRISFPILESKVTNPKCVGMAYRTLSNDIKPKYINDKNQDGREGQDPNVAGIFIKGDLLYGYSQAYKAIKENNYAILTEGYMDVISLHQAGIKNSVAAMGTSVTEAQIKLLSKITKNILLILDGDQPGINAAIRIIPTILSEGINLNLCILPNGIDPADLCMQMNFDIKQIREIIYQNSISAIQFIVNQKVKNYETTVTKERLKIVSDIQPLFNAIQDPIVKEIYQDMLFKRLDIRR